MADSTLPKSRQQTWMAQTGISPDCWIEIISFLPINHAIKFSLINQRCLSFVPKHITVLRDNVWRSKIFTRLLRLEHLIFTWSTLSFSAPVFPNKRQLRFLLSRNPKLKTLILQSIFTRPKERWIEHIIPAGVEHLDVQIPGDLSSLERLAGRLKRLQTLVLRTHEIESTEKLEAILMPWKNHTTLVNVDIIAAARQKLLVDVEQVIRIAPINCGPRLKVCGETVFTIAMESASFDPQEAERLLSLGLSLEDTRLALCLSKEAVQYYAAHARFPPFDIASTILAWALGNHEELVDVFLKTCEEQHKLQLLSDFNHVGFWRQLISQSLHPRFSDALACLMREDVKKILNLDVHIRFPGNRTLLHEAVSSYSPKVLDIFLDAGVDPDLRDDRGFAAAEVAIISGFRQIARSESYTRLLNATKKVSGDLVVIQLDDDGNPHSKTVLHVALQERAVPLIERIVDSLSMDEIYSLYFSNGLTLSEWLVSVPGTAPMLQRIFDRSEKSQIAKRFPLKDICIENLSVAERILKAGAKCSLLDFDCLIFRSNIAEYSHIFELVDPSQWKNDASLHFTSSMLYRIVDNLPASQEPIILKLLDDLEENVDPRILSASFGSKVAGKDVFDNFRWKEPTEWRRVVVKLVQMAAKVNFPIEASKMKELQPFL